MANVLSREKREQVLALGRLGWSLRRIEEATGVRRETASRYLRAAGVSVRPVGRWGHAPAKPAIEVSTDSAGAQAAANAPDPPAGPPPTRSPQASACEPYRDWIEEAVRSRSAGARDLAGPGRRARLRGALRECASVRREAPRGRAARSAPADRDRARRRGPGRLRRWPDGAPSRDREVPPHAALRPDARPQPQGGAPAHLEVELADLGGAP